jgi:hypothetical protein
MDQEEINEKDPYISIRAQIRQTIETEQIEETFKLLEQLIPGFIKSNPELYFQLQCIQFITYVRQKNVIYIVQNIYV